MSILFEPYKIRSLEIRNRFIRSATTSYWSDEEGMIRPEIVNLYHKLAEGGVGLIIKGHLYVSDLGKAHTGMGGISKDKHTSKLKKLTSIVHKNGGKIVAQLNHAGIHSILDRAGPSEHIGDGWKARSLSSNEIINIVKAFGDAAYRAMTSGFDGVQIHGAHGYLISQFLSRITNRRTDEWGGSLKYRMKILLEVYDEMRSKVGDKVPIMLKMNCDDFSPNGFTIRDSVKVAETIRKRGVACLEVSGGGVGRQRNLMERARSKDPDLYEASFSGYAMKIKEVMKSTPLALVKGLRSIKCMENVIDKGVADLVSLSRPFIKEPDLVKKLESGQPTAKCLSCDTCSSSDIFGKMMLRCHLD